MNKNLITLGFLVSFSLTAFGEGLPPYYGRLEGTVFANLLECQSFEFTPGIIKDCKHQPGTSIELFECAVEGAQAKIYDARGSLRSFTFTSLKTMKLMDSKEQWQSHILTGKAMESLGPDQVETPVKLTLWYYLNRPEEIRGTLELIRFGVVSPLEVRRTGR